jgi:hypothetical protein
MRVGKSARGLAQSKTWRLIAAVLLLSTLNFQLSTLYAQGTVFTYQGRLDSGGTPFTGSAEFQATLWSVPSGGTQVAANTPAIVVVSVTNGLFVLPLDFGLNFPGTLRWLQLEVRTTLGPFTPLTPRQRLTATPYAITAGTAVTVSGTVPPAALANAWKTSGNSGTTPGTHFLGTTDGQPLELRAAGVGIGTFNPAATLDVRSSRATSADNTATFANTSIGPRTSYIHYGTNGDWYIRSASDRGNVIIQDVGRNVGIGTSTPTDKLHVNGTTRLQGNATVGGFFALSRSSDIAHNNSVVVPTTSYVEVTASGLVSLNPSTAIADGPAVGAILILQGSANMGASDVVLVPNNANTRLDIPDGGLGNVVGLGSRGTLTLIWDGSDWVQLSYSNYQP